MIQGYIAWLGEGAAETVVVSRHNSYRQALLQRTQVQKISTCNLCIIRRIFLEISGKYSFTFPHQHSILKMHLNNKLSRFQIPWDISDPEIGGVNALSLWDRGLRMSNTPGYIGCWMKWASIRFLFSSCPSGLCCSGTWRVCLMSVGWFKLDPIGFHVHLAPFVAVCFVILYVFKAVHWK